MLAPKALTHGGKAVFRKLMLQIHIFEHGEQRLGQSPIIVRFYKDSIYAISNDFGNSTGGS